jgi:hypothetical protein
VLQGDAMEKAKQSRDINIIKNYQREINLQTKSIESRKKYTRKIKHKNM